MKRKLSTPFRSAKEEVLQIPEEQLATKELTKPNSAQLAFLDQDFLLRDETRHVRLQLEALKPEVILQENHIQSTIVVFGSARVISPELAQANLTIAQANYKKDPSIGNKVILKKCEQQLAQSRFYKEAQEFGRLVSICDQVGGACNYVIMTGGGPGIMEAANRGASEAGAKTIGLNIALPFEQAPNSYLTPELSFHFHYFSMRKMHFLIRARALIAFPGGFGTLDELFEVLTLVQTKKILPIPILLFGKRYWEKLINFELLIEEGYISQEDINLFHYVESATEAWQYITNFFNEQELNG